MEQEKKTDKQTPGNLLNRILQQGKTEGTTLTSVVDLARELGCLGDILGREFEVRDPDGNLVFRVVQKPLKLVQLKTIGEEVTTLRKMEEERIKKGKRK